MLPILTIGKVVEKTCKGFEICPFKKFDDFPANSNFSTFDVSNFQNGHNHIFPKTWYVNIILSKEILISIVEQKDLVAM